ncbi:MAG TPA: NAD(P)H-dependent glycerol-3-phosphate dehydrogenase [Parasegetibacter sp.]
MNRFGVIGSGSWATALTKILTDSQHKLNWWVRNEQIKEHIQQRNHNPNYLSSVYFDLNNLNMYTDMSKAISASDVVVIAVPSAYLEDLLVQLPADAFEGKKVVSAVKGILPKENILLNEYLSKHFNLELSNYFTIMGPCHAEEVASERLSYLTFSGVDEAETRNIAANFNTPYITTIVNHDIYGVQYAAILKNIYAIGAGIAHGLDYGDNFQSVYIANVADEMAGFLRKVGIQGIEVGVHGEDDPVSHKKSPNYAASVYLGDLLVTCYSLHSRNRTFGNMVGKGYSVMTAQLEMNMVAEGYNASRCMHIINQKIGADMPIASTIYRILWEQLPARKGFSEIEKELV